MPTLANPMGRVLPTPEPTLADELLDRAVCADVEFNVVKEGRRVFFEGATIRMTVLVEEADVARLIAGLQCSGIDVELSKGGAQ